MDPSERLSNLREVNGRIFNTTNESYILPADGVEHRRLDAQHQAVTTMLGDLFPKGSGAAEILARSFERYKPRVLDLGTGSGAWAIDVAIKYPNVEVVGLDLAPVNPGLPPPPNCRFEQGDATTGLKQYGRFDVVHARAMLQGVKDFAALFGEVAEVLNPQGVFVSIEAETCLYDKNKTKYGPQKEGDIDFSWTQELAMAYSEATRKRNPDFPNLLNVSDILEEGPGERWETIGRTTFLLPCGPCEGEGERERVAGKLMHQSVLQVPKGLQVLFLSSGFAADYVNRLTEMASEEIVNCRVMNWMKWFVVWAVKSSRPAEFGPEVDVEPERYASTENRNT